MPAASKTWTCRPDSRESVSAFGTYDTLDRELVPNEKCFTRSELRGGWSVLDSACVTFQTLPPSFKSGRSTARLSIKPVNVCYRTSSARRPSAVKCWPLHVNVVLNKALQRHPVAITTASLPPLIWSVEHFLPDVYLIYPRSSDSLALAISPSLSRSLSPLQLQFTLPSLSRFYSRGKANRAQM